MKQCECGFTYERKEELEMLNLIYPGGVIDYFCPNCKEFQTSQKLITNNNLKTAIGDLQIEFIENVYENKKDVLWYGGLVCEISYKDISFQIEANGDVIGTIYKDGEELISFKDKYNNGEFRYVLDSYLPEVETDIQIHSLIDCELTESEIKEKKLTAIVLYDNNWWEVSVYKNNSKEMEYVDSFVIDFSDDIYECIDYIVNEKDNLYNKLL